MKSKMLLIMVIVLGCKPESEKPVVTEEVQINKKNTDTLKNIELISFSSNKSILYLNAEDIIYKALNITHKRLEIEIPGKKIKDSVNFINADSYIQLNKIYSAKADEIIQQKIDLECKKITALDSELRETNNDTLKKYKLNILYFVKTNKTYKVYFLRGEPNPRTLKYRIKHLIEIDTLNRNILSSSVKDEMLINELKDLQND